MMTMMKVPITQQTVANMSDNLAIATPVVPPIIEKRFRYGRLVRYGEDI